MPGIIEAIEDAPALGPTLWWLGGRGFAVKYRSIVFYVDPVLDSCDAAAATHADMVLRTHADGLPDDPTPAILAASPRARVLIPKSAADVFKERGIGYGRMTTTDADLRVEYFKGGVYGRVYSVPSSRGGLGWTALGGYPYLGYLMRFGRETLYHAGACTPYEGLADRLRPYNVTAALLPIGPGNFQIAEAAMLAQQIRAEWVVPMDCGDQALSRFIDHMLGHHPEQRFKVFRVGEGWEIPEEPPPGRP
ncbi:MAG: MBL fold metallo-hydrolase [Acidobacteria bacterium]|nr:MBL fold metallo-hydrolase [Acidobacteriota bacterium]MBI3282053.1 MBL fold metallo-hydrolase [Acidobacteriota bacterium]